MSCKGALTYFFNEINHLERFSKADANAKKHCKSKHLRLAMKVMHEQGVTSCDADRRFLLAPDVGSDAGDTGRLPDA